MSIRSRHIIIVVLLALVVCLSVWLAAVYHQVEPEIIKPTVMNGDSKAVVEKTAVHLYFASTGASHLVAEQMIADRLDDPAALGRLLVQSLIRGPRKGAVRTLPEGCRLAAFYIADNGLAVVDFEKGAFDRHPGGIEVELLSIYSLVNTLVLNVDAIRQVQLLIGGRVARTLAGHVDIQRPFSANMLWIR